MAEDSVSEREEQQAATEPPATRSQSQEFDSKKSDNDKGRDWLEAIKEVEEEPNMECEDDEDGVPLMETVELMKEEKISAKQNMDEAKEKLQVG